MKSTQNQIVFTIFIQTDFRLDPNQLENGKYNRISGWFNKISKRFLSVRALRAAVQDAAEHKCLF